jgi:hypothetical protein
MAKDGPKGKVIEFSSVRKTGASNTQVKSMVNAPGIQSSTPRSGFLDTWLKGHEDSQSLVKENLSLQEQKRRLEEERDSLIPSLSENLIYYASLIFAIGALLGLVMLAR